MSEEAYRIYGQALKEQSDRTIARTILTHVKQARDEPLASGFRWPFELLQNALDAGPRAGRPAVKVRFRRDSTKVVFEHDGAPFTLKDLAALLSGGSNKPLPSSLETQSEGPTGRFGTGFLATHVLAERTRLRGLLEVPTGHESFDLTLERGGDEDAILENIRHADEAIRSAVGVPDAGQVATAVIEYASSKGDIWAHGMQELRRSLPYLYGTRRTLGHVEILSREGMIETWEPSETDQRTINGGYMECRAISVTGQNRPRRKLNVYRFATASEAPAGALVLVEQTAGGVRVHTPEENAPRVFREYPLRASGFVPLNFVLDGRFDPDKERSRLRMNPSDKALLEEALSAASVAVEYAIGSGWIDAHNLAFASRPATGFDRANDEETAWWADALAEFAKRLAAIPIVDCGSQVLPAVSTDEEGVYADFIIPRLSESSGTDETSIERVWSLVEAAERLCPPRKELAADWTVIAEGWRTLGLEIEPLFVAGIPRWIRSDAGTLETLAVNGDAQEWLAVFIDIVGECWTKRDTPDLSALSDVLPNQNQRLCSPSELKRDEGVSDRLKDICSGMGYDIRRRLLLGGFEGIAHSRELRYLADALKAAIPTSLAEDDVVGDALNYMTERLPENETRDNVDSRVQQATVQLFAHLWESKKEDATPIARRVPLLASNHRVERWSSNRQFMAPVQVWPESARPFANAYPPNRVLADLYAGSEADGIPNVTVALAAWGIALLDPVTETTVGLQDRRLGWLSATANPEGVIVAANAEGIIVPEERLSQIALLTPAVLNHCQEGINEARALLGLLLCHVAPRDPAWKEQRIAKGRRSREEVDVSIRGALWLADLKIRAWVPMPGEDDKPQKVGATAATLKHLLDPTWLRDNGDGIELLTEWFGFDRLELQLMSVDQGKEVRTSLAKLLETGGNDPQLYAALAAEVDAKRRRGREVNQCRNLGLAVQAAIGAALRRHRLRVKLVDRGFDYEVAISSNNDVTHDCGSKFEIGPYLVEVKATTTGEARLTPLQAATASENQSTYVLCVVDLRDAADLTSDWTADQVEPLAKLVADIGGSIEETYHQVERARALDVSIRNESALRYEVAPQIWEAGVSITDWVKAIRTALERLE